MLTKKDASAINAVPTAGFLLEDVNREMGRAVTNHGPFPRNQDRAMVILSEEFGEVARAVAEVGRLPRLGEKRPSHLNNLRSELVQVMATCGMWIDNLDSEGKG